MRESILAQFNQDAIKYLEKKKYEKLKRIQEEKEYLLKQEQKYNEEQKIAKERRKKKEQQFNEYNLMLSRLNYRTPVNKFIPKIETDRKKPFIKFNENELETNKSLQKREKEIILRRDIIGKYLTDENNTEELVKDLRRDREKSLQFYKEINDLQYLEYQKNNIDLYGTIDPLIIKRYKRKFITDNPYHMKIKNDYWKSNLSHNPITNPDNDMNYNKYIFKEENDIKVSNTIANDKRRSNTINNMININNTIKNNKKTIDSNHFRKIRFIKNLKSNNNIINTRNNEMNNNFSFDRHDLEMKKRFFNISNSYINNKSNNYIQEEMNFNSNIIYRAPEIKRKILRQAISSNFLH
mgnify:FL=1